MATAVRTGTAVQRACSTSADTREGAGGPHVHDALQPLLKRPRCAALRLWRRPVHLAALPRRLVAHRCLDRRERWPARLALRLRRWLVALAQHDEVRAVCNALCMERPQAFGQAHAIEDLHSVVWLAVRLNGRSEAVPTNLRP